MFRYFSVTTRVPPPALLPPLLPPQVTIETNGTHKFPPLLLVVLPVLPLLLVVLPVLLPVEVADDATDDGALPWLLLEDDDEQEMNGGMKVQQWSIRYSSWNPGRRRTMVPGSKQALLASYAGLMGRPVVGSMLPLVRPAPSMEKPPDPSGCTSAQQ
jgi:hypothetical protein